MWVKPQLYGYVIWSPLRKHLQQNLDPVQQRYEWKNIKFEAGTKIVLPAATTQIYSVRLLEYVGNYITND